MKVLMFLADGFEDTEAVATRDVLMRSGLRVVTASVMGRIDVVSSFGLHTRADTLIEHIHDVEEFAALILPGGGRGTNNLLASKRLAELLNEAHARKILIAAICAAPMVLGKCGLLKGLPYTCFAGCEEGLEGKFTAGEVEITEHVITARSMAYAIPFGLAIVTKLLGASTAARAKLSMEGLAAK